MQNIVFKTLGIRHQRIAIPERWETDKMSLKITSVYYCLQTSLWHRQGKPRKKTPNLPALGKIGNTGGVVAGLGAVLPRWH